MWGLDAIKTRGESVAIALSLIGARPVKEGTGRVVKYELVPLKELQRPRVDILASLSGIFRDSFANVVDLLDDLFEAAANAEVGERCAVDPPNPRSFSLWGVYWLPHGRSVRKERHVCAVCRGQDEPLEMNYIRKHTLELAAKGVERPTARLFSNPAGDFGSMVNERVSRRTVHVAEAVGCILPSP